MAWRAVAGLFGDRGCSELSDWNLTLLIEIDILLIAMTLAHKLRQLRQLEGDLRGLGRPMTQSELVRGIKQDLGGTISQSYLSLIEKGSRKHLSNESRQLLARFFKVHPGYLVSDPPGFQTELTSDVGTTETRLDRWLLEGFCIGLVRGGTDLTGRALRLVQTGNLQTYAFLFVLGVALVLYFVLGK